MMIVIAPMTATGLRRLVPIEKAVKNTPYMRATRKTPATTMVAAWIRADTGVGPAMASGSQVWRGNWADLPITAQSRATAPMSNAQWVIRPWTASSLIRCASNVRPAAKNRIDTPTSSPTSPTRVVKNAFRAASEMSCCSHQWPISMKEQRPMISQPRIIWRVVEAVTRISMPLVNRDNAA